MVASVSSSTSSISNWNQRRIEKPDPAGALAATGKSDGSGDSDGKVTRREPGEAVSKLSDQLNAQFDASRVQGGMPGAGGPRGGGGGGGAQSTGSTASATTSTDYVAAADTDGDGTVSDAEQAAYDKKVALNLLKAYADSGSDASGTPDGSAAGNVGVSAEA